MPEDTFARLKAVYFDGDMEAAPALAGQTAGLIDTVKTAEQIINDTVAEFFAITQRMGALAAAGGSVDPLRSPFLSTTGATRPRRRRR